MNDVSQLAARIQSELDAGRQRIETFRAEKVDEYRQRQIRHEQFLVVLGKVRALAKPRFEKLAELVKFDTKPLEMPGSRGVEMAFKTDLATVRMQVRAAHDEDVRNLLLEYELEILPIFFRFNPKASLTVPLDQFDEQRVVQWFDDRIVEFVKTYVQLHFTDEYQRDQMVTDPVAKIRFPKVFAKSTVEHGGQTLYFLSDETRAAFEGR